tara:strand:+ start:637 stop:1002 length:366 start_codon:yes stop_codon:yes gene_type:complete
MQVVITDYDPNRDEWFPNPLDSMPVATDKGGFDWEDTAPSEYEPPNDNKWAPAEKRAELESNPRPEEEVADWFAENPDESDDIEKEKTMHEKMYQIATAKYNPFAVGGSENLGGGSEQIQK